MNGEERKAEYKRIAQETGMSEEQVELVLAIFKDDISIIDAIILKGFQDLTARQSFRECDKDSLKTLLYGDFQIIRYYFMLLEAHFTKLHCHFKNVYYYDNLIDDLKDEIRDTQEDIRVLNQIVRAVRKKLIQLRWYRVPTCNVQIDSLIKDIYRKEKLLRTAMDIYLDKYNYAVQGINYYSPDKNQESINEVDESINSSIMVLGLSKQTFSDKE